MAMKSAQEVGGAAGRQPARAGRPSPVRMPTGAMTEPKGRKARAMPTGKMR